MFWRVAAIAATVLLAGCVVCPDRESGCPPFPIPNPYQAHDR